MLPIRHFPTIYKYCHSALAISRHLAIHPSLQEILLQSFKFDHFFLTMADKCGNCDCADKSQCVKKGPSYTADVVETEKKTFVETVVMEGAENGGCKCGPSCACTDCTC